MKHFLVLPCLLLAFLAAQGAEPPTGGLHLKAADVERVTLELEPSTSPQVRIYLTKDKIGEAQALMETSVNKPLPIFMNEKLVVEPTLTKPLRQKIRYLTMTFNDFATAAEVARAFVPTK